MQTDTAPIVVLLAVKKQLSAMLPAAAAALPGENLPVAVAVAVEVQTANAQP